MVDLFKTLLEEGASPDIKDQAGEPILIQAVRYNKKFVEPLLKAGANPDIFNKRNHESALVVAMQQKSTDLIKKLIDYKANPHFISEPSKEEQEHGEEPFSDFSEFLYQISGKSTLQIYEKEKCFICSAKKIN
eukprot:CAMPEP_0114579602 /NCGR_PEP_ID=MMETSP0125-20121206/3941_1 /TAXON_ID=485358 ORGANISM="Aristerostoma sp., Strain ATCC 50986" /NCGR_SAMPLE_ID=MMETSP0125 /ASSEMBLY_ACC=CAM_ASM_000245 /LENGTH=132 /DNA_ID=CAMNT_0001770435 /DNA_START=1554 /DNA_END=1952 /DNA_ORIENTATION=-